MEALLADVTQSHHLVEERLARARAATGNYDPDRPRDKYPPIDTFLATASRYYTALGQVLVPAARRRLPDGDARTKAFLTQSRRLAVALNAVKAKLYGSVYAVDSGWPALWRDVDREFLAIAPMELELAEGLDKYRRDDDPEWSTLLYRAEVNAPTRPHPHLPQQGVAGRIARMVTRRVDSFWDTAEGRMAPEPVSHHDRTKDGPMTQWMLGDPHMGEGEGERPDRLHRAPRKEQEEERPEEPA